MTPEQIQELIDTLLGMGQTMATEAFEIAMQQVEVLLVLRIFWLVIAVIFLLVGFPFGRKGWNHIQEEDDSEWGWAFVIYMVGAFFAIATILANSNEIIKLYLNPEWYAIQNIMSLLR